MFTNQKIEPSQWPWAYLQSIQDQNTTQWIELREQIPVVYNLNGPSSEHDTRFVFKDLYVDLAREVTEETQLSIETDGEYLA